MATKGAKKMTAWVAWFVIVLLSTIGIGLIAFAIWVTAAMENFDDFNWPDDD